MEHERLCHQRIWRCFDRQHRDIIHSTKERLHIHLSESHTDLNELQIQNILELVETTVADNREMCPFCNSIGPFSGGLYNHMAFHQEKFAAFAIPRNIDKNDNEGRSIEAQGSRSARSLNSISLRPKKSVIGVCVLDAKAQSRAFRNILGRFATEFELVYFGDKAILEEDIENWPTCDFLISFFSEGFPLEKAEAYAQLRKPFCVNDIPMQQVLWDRRLCLQILDNLNVPTPKRIEVSRDGGPRLKTADFARELFERTGVRLQGPPDGTGGGLPEPSKIELLDGGNTICVDGASLSKPFLEKSVNKNDPTENTYYHEMEGGIEISWHHDTPKIPRSITEQSSSYIYEEFVPFGDSKIIKVYTIGSNYYYAGIGILSMESIGGRRIRLNESEVAMASKISEGFGQRVCGFDIVRHGDRSFVDNVYGGSFAEESSEYCDEASEILRDMFLKKNQRKLMEGVERKLKGEEIERMTELAAAESKVRPKAAKAKNDQTELQKKDSYQQEHKIRRVGFWGAGGAGAPASGSWICSECNASNSYSTTGFCPICGQRA